MKALQNLTDKIGPGLLYAGAAIGVSHLIQSTRAGAEYGWLPILGIVFIHLAKYPFFKMGPRYALSTGESLIAGYKRLGWWAILLFVLFTVGTMFAIIAAIVSVTSGITAFIFGIEIDAALLSGLILGVATTLLMLGKYRFLDRLMSLVILLLSLSTVIAFFLALGQYTPNPEPLNQILDGAFLIMLVKLMGWMPAPMDISVWHSIWALEKESNSNDKFKFKQAMRDFEIGYWGTMVMGILFLGMGALLLFHSAIELPGSGVGFSEILLSMYTSQLGTWAFGIVATAALATMFSTTLTCLDAIPRSLAETWKVTLPGSKFRPYLLFLAVLSAGSFALLFLWAPSMVQMVDFATVLSFCATPVIAFLNFKAMGLRSVKGLMRLSKVEYIYAAVCLFALLGFTLWYIRLVS